MRKRLETKTTYALVAGTNDGNNKCFFSKRIFKNTAKKIPHVMCYGKLIAISVTKALELSNSTDIIML